MGGVGRIAVLHEWMEAIGGSEAVTLEILRALPGSDLLALWVAPDARDRFPPVQETALRRLPRPGRKMIALAATPVVWRTMRTARYDTVIAGSHALGHTARLRSSPDARYLSYVHTPARYVWMPELDGRGSSRWLTPARRALGRIDVAASRHIDSYAANSTETRERIRRHWNADAVVIPPPVDTEFFAAERHSGRGGYLLSVGRLIPYKRHDMAISAGEQLGVPVRIIGTGPLAAELRRRAAAARVPVEVITTGPDGGRPSREQIRSAMAEALALIFAAHEDFGIVPVEAQAVGLPVVGLGRGGIRDTVLPGRTGVLLDSLDPPRWAAAIEEAVGLDRDTIRAHAQTFSSRAFRAAIREWVGTTGLTHEDDPRLAAS